MLKFISWNIASLNAALTSDSPRAQLSRDVPVTLAKEDADLIAIQETKLPAAGPAKKHTEALTSLFPGYRVEWVSSEPPARKGYAGTMILCKEAIKAERIVPRIGAPGTMDDEGRLLVLDCGGYYLVKKILFYCNRDGLYSIDVIKGIDDKESGYDDSEERRELEKAAKMLFG